MAEILSSSTTERKHRSSRSKKLSTRVDLTPMVDLGFLLITFFIFTTSMTEPRALNFYVPADGDSTQAPRSKTLNIVLLESNKINYYIGDEVWKQSCTDFSPQGIRNVVIRMKHAIAANNGNAENLVVLIRPTGASSYMNLVDILDEMLILDVKKYALMEEPGTEILLPSNIKNPC